MGAKGETVKVYQREDWRELKPHPAAEVFALMNEDERAGMVAGMREHGYRKEHPVIICAGLVADGRNRLAACLETGVEPWFADYEGDDVLSFIVSANLDRRHLNTSQRAMAAVDFIPFYAAAAREKQREAGGDKVSDEARALCPNSDKTLAETENRPIRATEQAGKKLGVGRQITDEARQVRLNAPELAEEVKAGRLTVAAALKQVRKGRKETKTAVKTTKLPKGTVKKYPRLGAELSLEEREERMEGKVEAFLDVAYELWQIREQSLFKKQHAQFHHYLQSRWGIVFRLGEMTTCGIDSLELSGQKRKEEG
jgi:hypothetical protein